MSEQLYIRLGSKREQPVFWLIWSDTEKEVIASGELPSAFELASLEQRAGGRNASILVPSSCVSFKKVITPAKANRQVLQALPYMLEEELANDVDELFFAIGDKYSADEGNVLETAVVSQEQMTEWLDWLDEAKIQCRKILPDSLALPWQAGCISIIQLGDEWLVRSESFLGLVCCEENLDFWLEHTAGESTKLIHYSPLPESLTVNSKFEVEAGDYSLALELLAKGCKESKFNLRQGQFQFKKDSSQFVKIWRNAAIVAAIAIGVNIVSKVIEVNNLNEQVASLDKQIRQTYSSVFPNARNLSVALISKEIKKKLAASGTSSDASFLHLIDASAQAFSAVPDLKPDSIRYDAKRAEIRINASANNFQSFERFKTTAAQSDLVVEQGSLNSKGSQVVGAISIRSAS
ncbi:type II secretion system protein GspL [Catenovulum maritimum]|uniref:Type II secretion system protein L n=1 Tax=Catenovulum maritimum TaxID=1513271 RepID=A0A0J8GP75_9ALTE|nr:type II secretion system protein GspL [Catenovulum maritimum]KMT64615.1 hypothetical protein XM47_13305 [Catenovulum maritimum]